MLLATVVAAGGAVLTGMSLHAVRSEMVAARGDIRRGSTALLAGDAATARAAFDRAGEHAAAARLQVQAPPLRVAAILPAARQQVRTADALVTATGLAARAGRELSIGAGAIEGGMAAVAPRDGRFPMAPLRALHGRLRHAADLVVRAEVMVRDADHSVLLPELRAARATALRELEPAVEALGAAAGLADALPAFLGADGTQRHLFGAATPAELRGTGGLIGAYAPMTARDGKIRFGRFVPASRLPRAVDDPPPPPSDEYQRRYGRFAAAGHWSNINMTPDFPTAAVAIERLYARAVGERVDGVVVADPFALRLLLGATGRIDVPGVGPVDRGTVVDYLTHRSYVELPDPAARKAVLGRVAVAVFERFLRSPAPPERKIRLLAEAVGGGHVLLHARDERVQAALVRAGVAGDLIAARGDFVAVVANNAAGNKIDHFAERELDYRVQLASDGTARGHLEVSITNTAPAGGLPRYVIGPADDRFAPGENVMLLSTYCAMSCRVEGHQVDGRPAAVGQQPELGRQVLPATVRVPAGDTRRVTYDWKLLRAWEPTGAEETYRVALQGQPTVRPTRVALRVRVPPGTRITRVTDGARAHGAEVRWTGTLGRVAHLEIAFTRRQRGWQRLRAALEQPAR